MTKTDLEQLEQAVMILASIIERQRIHEENANERRLLFKLVDNTDTGKVIPFPAKKESPNLGMLGNAEQEFVEFTDKEIYKMPKQFRKIFTFNRRAAHVRKKNDVYEIRLQIDGYRIAASSKVLETAKLKFISQLLEYERTGRKSLIQKPKKRLLVPYIQLWLDTVKRPFIKDGTYKFYMQACEAYIFPRFENRTIESLTQFELQGFINEFASQEKFRTADKVALILSAVLDYAVDDGIIQRSPMKRVVLPTYEEEHGQAFTREEEKTLILSFLSSKNIYAQAYVFMLYTGLRRGELKSAIVENDWVSVVTGKQRKGLKEKRRRIPLCPMLARYIEHIDIAAITALSPAMLTKHIKDYLPTHHCHDLRHTFITRCQECGVKREIVSLWAGHAADSSITSNVYTHLEQNEDLQIQEMRLFTYDLA